MSGGKPAHGPQWSDWFASASCGGQGQPASWLHPMVVVVVCGGDVVVVVVDDDVVEVEVVGGWDSTVVGEASS